MRKPQMLALLAVIGLGVLGILFFRTDGNMNSNDEQDTTTWNIFSHGSAKNIPAKSLETTSPEEPKLDALTRYVNIVYGFSFEHPKEMTVTALDEDTGETILVQKSGGSDSFQIFVLPWDELEYAVITKERIRQDVPEIVIDELQEAILADRTHALLF